MDFSAALAHLKTGHLVAREGWNGKGMFLYLVEASTFNVNRPPLLGIFEPDTEVNYHAHVDMWTAGDYAVPWLCSQADMLAEDWVVVTKPAYMRDSIRMQEAVGAANILEETEKLNRRLAKRLKDAGYTVVKS